METPATPAEMLLRATIQKMAAAKVTRFPHNSMRIANHLLPNRER